MPNSNITQPAPATDDRPGVFISYSHDSDEHKAWVERLAFRLEKNGVHVILDQWDLALGSNLQLFINQGLSKSRRVLCICTDIYCEKANSGHKVAGYESTIIASHLMDDQNKNWIIPIVRETSNEETPVPLSLKPLVRLDMRKERDFDKNLERLWRDITGTIIKGRPEIEPNPAKNIAAFAPNPAPTNARFHSPALKGRVTFDYGDNSGNYTLGRGEMQFTLWFSGKNEGVISLNSHPGVPKGTMEIKDVTDARAYDRSSRSRGVYVGQVAVLRNEHGCWLALRPLSVKLRRSADGENEIVFDYVIQTNGSPDFSST